MKIKYLITLLCLCALPCIAIADTIEVGTGANTALVYIEWSDGFSAEFNVHFGEDANDTTTGLGLIDIIEANIELTTVRNDFGYGEYIDGISYSDHNDSGYGGGELWWHYWENNAGSKNPWVSSMTGAGGRSVSNGDADAWIYGSAEEPPAIDVIEVGSGVNQASVYIEWSDGFTADFLVNFGISETETTTGLDLINIIEAETGLTTVRGDFGYGEYIDGISYLGHDDSGYLGEAFYWHYWTNNAGSRYPWESSWVGASSRVVSHGDADGWIYGHDEKPAPSNEDPFIEGYGQYYFDANDFATSWIDYNPNGMIYDWLSDDPYDNPESALGRPTVDTSSDEWLIPPSMNVPVVPVYSAFRASELVYLGEQGTITLGFSHQVSDDVLNPYGIDFIVFGNAAQAIGQNQLYANGDPQAVTVSSKGGTEPGIVSVSQDGITWYSFTNDPNFMKDDPNFIILDPNSEDGPFCDSFAPTLGRVYNTDPCYIDTTLGSWNQWWAEETNPTLPLNPEFTYKSFDGMSIARIAQTYGDSAGGTGFDLARLDLPVDPNTGLKWFSYIRIDDIKDGNPSEIDAVADVSCPGDYRHQAPIGDLNGDYCVDDKDIAIAESYLGQEITSPEDEAAIADLNGDDIVNQDDIDIITANLGNCTWGWTTVYE